MSAADRLVDAVSHLLHDATPEELDALARSAGWVPVEEVQLASPAARSTDPGASRAAAELALPGARSQAVRLLRAYRARYREALQQWGNDRDVPESQWGWTADEAEQVALLPGATRTSGRRVSDLVRHGFLEPITGEDEDGNEGEAVRPSRAGRLSRVLRITDAGLAYLRTLDAAAVT